MTNKNITSYSFDSSSTKGQDQAHPIDFIALLKPRVMSLVVFTAWVGLMVAPGGLHVFEATLAILCIAIAAGASGAINMWYDRDIDAIMHRTRNRPIPAGRVNASEALSFGIILSVLSVVVLGLATNWVAAGLLAFSIFFYGVVYTIWLKRSTSQNIVIGGAAGAFPPVIGWASVTGSVDLDSLVLFLIIFIWTPPHFWALSLFRNTDYTRANIPMLPVVSGYRSTQRHILAYSLVLAPLSTVPYITGLAGPAYLGVALILGLIFIGYAVAVFTEDGPAHDYKAARSLFAYSIIYLFALFLILFIDTIFLKNISIFG